MNGLSAGLQAHMKATVSSAWLFARDMSAFRWLESNGHEQSKNLRPYIDCNNVVGNVAIAVVQESDDAFQADDTDNT